MPVGISSVECVRRADRVGYIGQLCQALCLHLFVIRVLNSVFDFGFIFLLFRRAGLGVTPCANSCAKSGRKTAEILNKVFDLAKCEQRHGLQTGK